MAPSESRFDWTFLTLGDLCQTRANSQDWHFGIPQEDVEAKLVFMMGGWHCNLPNKSSKIWFCIIACRRCIPIPSFQCQRSNSFWGINKFSFFRPPTHGKLETRPCFLDNVDKFWLTDTLASSQALHKAQLHEEQTKTFRHAPSWPFQDTKELCTMAKFVVFLSMGIEIKAPSLRNFITTSSPFTTEWPPLSWWYIWGKNNRISVNGRW